MRIRTVPRILCAVLVMLGLMSPAVPALAAERTDLSRAVADSTMAAHPAEKLGLGYPDALVLLGMYRLYQRTGEHRYLDYLKAWGTAKVHTDGSTGEAYDSLDSMLVGNVFLVLGKETGDERYHLAAQRIHDRLESYPKTTDGGFIHNTSLTGQLWADGVFMLTPFLASYASATGDPASATEAAKQLNIYFGHLRNPNGLLYHAYDEKRAQKWADPKTGNSPEVWCRAVGWFGAATVDVLDALPQTSPDRGKLIDIVRSLSAGYRKWQDPATGRWFQLPTRPDLEGNWTETSCSSLFTYTVSRAIQRGYVGSDYQPMVDDGYAGVRDRVSVADDGSTRITTIGVGTNVGDAPFYLARPRATNDFHGIGAFLYLSEQVTGTTPR
ncbi:glycoside hydrolase family 88/105 protein [Amycolatopsis jiangsuensis]|uniref:Unsaturated rhamnogalacturonyl hydrolase n=1 Tax=Amycolatopsis jiangsuensis TaxID=1181879 RepID=A0A840IKN4_9PSEU|nr:glycoside hydrolase family 88 protein [Amycolatopsis jiangsuensis]MBB4682866.1 unsaturated rhamnogalacturonyl hydrolase [Amycolatopsis jiangsuensis]